MAMTKKRSRGLEDDIASLPRDHRKKAPKAKRSQKRPDAAPVTTGQKHKKRSGDTTGAGATAAASSEAAATMSSSYLESQRAAFKGSLTSAASKLSNKKTTTSSAAAAAPASPSPSVGSTTSRNEGPAPTGTPPGKRKRNDATIYSQPENTGFGDQIGTQMHFALSYLREKNGAKTLDDVLGHLSLMKQSEQYKENMAEMLRRHPRVDFLPAPDVTEQTWHVGRYAYRPVIPGVKDQTSLLRYLQARKDASGVAVKDLKDGWPDCEPALASLEGAHKVLVIRTKKEGNPKHVYLDDPSLSVDIDGEFKNMWLRVPIPKAEELPRKLMAVGQKPTSEDPLAGNKNAAPKAKPQKKRAARRGGNVTNKHMEGVLKDFSHLKK